MKKKANARNSKKVKLELKTRESKTSGKYLLRLYVTGTASASVRAIQNLKRICEEYLDGAYDLEVIDLYQRPELARGEQIIAAPTLIKVLPLPLRRLIGDFSNEERVLFGLDVRQGALASKKGVR